MKSLRLFGLGIRLALAGGRASVVRLALMSIGLAVGVALLLGMLSFGPAVQARSRREAAREGQAFGGPTAKTSDATIEWPDSSTFEGIQVLSIAVRGVGDAPVPAGLPRLPGPGEAFVSPAMASLLAGPDGALLRGRVPGRVVGTIGPEGLIEPGEVVAFVDAPSVLETSSGYPLLSFEPTPASGGALDLAALVILVLGVLALLLPIGLFMLTATRLSASTREVRLAAVRLGGATQSQVRMLGAVESGLAAVGACVLGVPLFLLGRRAVSGMSVFGYRWFLTDATPSVLAVSVLLLAIPIFAVGVTLVGTRRLVVSPLGIVRRTPSTRRRSLWPALLIGGLLMMVWTAWHPDALMRQASPIPGIVVGAGLAMILVGLAGTAPWLGWLAARAVASRGPSPSVLLGARRLEAEPSSAGRIVSGVAVLIAVIGVAQAIALTGAPAPGGAYLAPWAEKTLTSSSIVVTPWDGRSHPEVYRSLATVPGVRSVAMIRKLPDGGTYSQPNVAVLQTDGQPRTVERVRNAVNWVAQAQTLSELRYPSSQSSNTALRIVRLMEFVTLFTLLVTAASLLVSTVDGMMERRRPIAVLSAIGVPTGVIRRSVFAQIAFPLISALILGVGGAVSVSWLLFRTVSEPLRLPVSSLLLTVVAVIALVLLVTAVALPWAGVARRPELLRNE